MTSENLASAATCSSLIERARQRNDSAWRELVDLYSPLIVIWCQHCRASHDETADCLQDVFSAAARSLDTYRASGSTGSFRGWLWTITLNKLRDAARRKAREFPAVGGSTALARLAEIPDPDSIPVDEPSQHNDLRELAARGLAQIQNNFAPQTWQAFWRSVVDGVATEIVARELELTPASVRQARSRVLRRLRQQLGDEE